MTSWIGILGYPLTHSLSEKIHQENIKYFGLPWEFRVLEWEPSQFKKNISKLKKDTSCIGFSVTMPYKEKIIAYLDECDDFVKKVSSVNCVKNNNGTWIGLNTDARGFLFHFQKWNPIPSREVQIVFLGAGATARTLSLLFANLGYQKFIFINRNQNKAKAWASQLQIGHPHLNVSTLEWENEDFPKQNIFILNTTPLGIKSEKFDWLEITKIKSPAWIFDITYNPPETLLIRQCRSRCFYTMNGWPMFQKQAELAFETWRSN